MSSPRQFLSQHLPFQGGVFAPPAGLKRLRIDVGLAFNAPMSELWLAEDSELCVVGFEPNVDSLALMRGGPVPTFPSTGSWIKPERIGQTFFPVPCALWDKEEQEMEFFKAAGIQPIGLGPDAGCSSRWARPEIDQLLFEKVKVPALRLADFLACVPFDRFPRVDYLKVDAEGSDVDVLRGAGRYLREYVVYVTAEVWPCVKMDFQNLMWVSNFIPVGNQEVVDPTFFNARFANAPGVDKIVCRQR